MAKYVGPKCRQCRREGTKLFLKGEKCYTSKCSVENRAFPPGQHGQRRGRLSDYAEGVLGLILAQPGVSAAVLFHYSHDGQPDCLAAAAISKPPRPLSNSMQRHLPRMMKRPA